MNNVATTLAVIQQGVRDYAEAPSNVAAALQGRTITPPVHFDIGLSTATVIDEPVIGFGNDLVGSDASELLAPDPRDPATPASQTNGTANAASARRVP